MLRTYDRRERGRRLTHTCVHPNGLWPSPRLNLESPICTTQAVPMYDCLRCDMYNTSVGSSLVLLLLFPRAWKRSSCRLGKRDGRVLLGVHPFHPERRSLLPTLESDGGGCAGGCPAHYPRAAAAAEQQQRVCGWRSFLTSERKATPAHAPTTPSKTNASSMLLVSMCGF